MTLRPYPVAAQAGTFVDELGDEVTLRPMMATDVEELLDFFRRIPEEDRYFLKEDVISKDVIQRWAHSLDYSRTLPILAFINGKVVADCTLHYNRAGARSHIGDIRVVVDPDYRRRGIGRYLLATLIQVATEERLEKLMFEVVDDTEEAAKHTARTLGFVPVCILPDHVKDFWGEPHDLITMELKLNYNEDDQYVF